MAGIGINGKLDIAAAVAERVHDRLRSFQALQIIAALADAVQRKNQRKLSVDLRFDALWHEEKIAETSRVVNLLLDDRRFTRGIGFAAER